MITIRLMTGSIIVHVAALLATSVSKSAIKHTIMIIMNCGKLSRIVNWLPNHCDRPEASEPSAIANPPPRSNNTPQETCSWVVFQSKSIGVVLSSIGFAGIIKKNKTINTAGVESLMNLLMRIFLWMNMLMFYRIDCILGSLVDVWRPSFQEVGIAKEPQ